MTAAFSKEEGMLPYSKIASRDPKAFPVRDFFSHPHLLAVDWRDDEGWMLKSFFKATAISDPSAGLTWDEPSKAMNFTVGGHGLAIRSSDDASAQHAMLLALQHFYGKTHSIRLLNHVINADTAYLMAETNEAWRQIEESFPLAKWFFTPIEALRDVFLTPFEEICAAGQRYAGG